MYKVCLTFKSFHRTESLDLARKVTAVKEQCDLRIAVESAAFQPSVVHVAKVHICTHRIAPEQMVLYQIQITSRSFQRLQYSYALFKVTLRHCTKNLNRITLITERKDVVSLCWLTVFQETTAQLFQSGKIAHKEIIFSDIFICNEATIPSDEFAQGDREYFFRAWIVTVFFQKTTGRRQKTDKIAFPDMNLQQIVYRIGKEFAIFIIIKEILKVYAGYCVIASSVGIERMAEFPVLGSMCVCQNGYDRKQNDGNAIKFHRPRLPFLTPAQTSLLTYPRKIAVPISQPPAKNGPTSFDRQAIP